MIGLPGPEACAPPGQAVTVYEVTAAPFAAAAANSTLACPSPALAETRVGAPGLPDGVTALEARGGRR